MQKMQDACEAAEVHTEEDLQFEDVIENIAKLYASTW